MALARAVPTVSMTGRGAAPRAGAGDVHRGAGRPPPGSRLHAAWEACEPISNLYRQDRPEAADVDPAATLRAPPADPAAGWCCPLGTSPRRGCRQQPRQQHRPAVCRELSEPDERKDLLEGQCRPRSPITQSLRSVLAETIRDGPRLPRPTDQRAHSTRAHRRHRAAGGVASLWRWSLLPGLAAQAALVGSCQRPAVHGTCPSLHQAGRPCPGRPRAGKVRPGSGDQQGRRQR